MYTTSCQKCLRDDSYSTFKLNYQDFKEFIDAENLMPLATSDFRNPVCLEMKTLRAEAAEAYSAAFREADVNTKTQWNNNNGDLGSMDSTDTFASCNTHPFLSQGDLTSDVADPSCAVDSNLYVNPMDKSGDNSPVTPAPTGRATGVKKSASGDTALRSLGTSPVDEMFKGFGAIDRGSRVSLNDSPLPKQRRTRFQQNYRPRTRFGNTMEDDSQESLEKRHCRKTFNPTRSFASATRIINQHLFGIQSLGGSKSGRNSGSKSSLSVDSIDSRASPQLEHHRRSKSILKKSDSSGHRNNDPESERLISDSTSGMDISSGGESPGKHLSSPPARHFSHKPVSRGTPSYQFELERTLRPPLFVLEDIIRKDKQPCNESVLGNQVRQCGDSGGEVPLYICPPPPPMDEHSPTEETRLLYHSSVVQTSSKTRNSISKGATPSS